MERTASDSWFTKRMMKLTHFEKWLMDRPQRIQRAEREALALFEIINLPPQPRCLEIGCGHGIVTRLLVERFMARVMATDLDPAQLALARERLADIQENVQFRVADAREMPFDETQFDGVFSFGVLHHVPGGWRRAVAETARVLSPGGWFVFTDLVLAPGAGRVVQQLLPQLDPLEETALRACLTAHGLRLVHYEHDSGPWGAIMRWCTAVAQKV